MARRSNSSTWARLGGSTRLGATQAATSSTSWLAEPPRRDHTETTPALRLTTSTTGTALEECGFAHGWAGLSFPSREAPCRSRARLSRARSLARCARSSAFLAVISSPSARRAAGVTFLQANRGLVQLGASVHEKRLAERWKGESKRDGEPWAVWVPSGSGVHLTALRASPRAGCCATSRSATTRRSARLRWSRPASPPSPGKRHRNSADASGPWPKERLLAADLRRRLSLEFAAKEECGAKQAAVTRTKTVCASRPRARIGPTCRDSQVQCRTSMGHLTHLS
jgi:hypothetical protein